MSPSDASAGASAQAPGLLERLAGLLASLLLGAVRALPEALALRIGGWVGTTYARLRGPRTDDALTNLRIAFPEWSDTQRRQAMVRSFGNLGRGFVEFARVGLLERGQLQERVAVEGLEHLEAARKASATGGVIVVTGHFGSWELLIAAMVARDIPASVVHRPRDNALVDGLVARLRDATGAEMLARGNAARAALEGVKKGRVLAMPYDQNCRRREGVFVPFFGRLACTRDGPARIAMRTGAPVVPVFIFRQPDGIHHVARFSPALEILPDDGTRDGALTENVRRMTAPIEAAIREAPDQWIWTHRRYRTQPEGEDHPY